MKSLFCACIGMILCCLPGPAGRFLYAQEEYRRLEQDYDSAYVSRLLQQSAGKKYISPDTALNLARKALMLSRNAGHERDIIRSYIAIGACLFNGQGAYGQAKVAFNKALEYARYLPPDDRLLPRLYNCLGNVYHAEGIYDSASRCYFDALAILERQAIKDTTALKLNYNNAGANFAAMGKVPEARFYLSKSLEIAQRQNDKEMMAHGYFYTGLAYANQQNRNLDSVIPYWTKALPLYLAAQQEINAFETCVNLGQAWMDKKDLSKAKMYYDSAAAMNNSAWRQSLPLLRGLGMFYHATGNNRLSLEYLQKALVLSEEHILRPYRLDLYKYLAQVYEDEGNYRQAFIYQRHYALLADSMINEKMVYTVSQLDIKYRAAEKDKELTRNKLKLALAEADLSRSHSRTIGLVFAAVILAVSAVILMQKQRLQLQKAKVAEQERRVEQLKAVFEGEERERTRIGRQLHDDIMVELSIVKMGLNALPIKFPDVKQSADYGNLVQQLNHTSSKLRQSAHNLMPDALLTEGLISAISYFCSNIRKMTGLKILFQHYGEIPGLAADVEISVYRIIQELVQNIIKHAGAHHALVQLNFRDNILSITVEDDGRGFDPQGTIQENKMGLKSMQARLKALNGVIDIHECNPHGTSVNISMIIPVQTGKNKQYE